jgi:hypothetical protein
MVVALISYTPIALTKATPSFLAMVSRIHESFQDERKEESDDIVVVLLKVDMFLLSE